MFHTVSYACAALYRSFSADLFHRMGELGLSRGALFPLLYIAKHPACTQAELTNALHLDWGHSQRMVCKLEEEGYLLREKEGRAYRLTLSERGQEVFARCQEAFADWDARALTALTAQERAQLLALLEKARGERSVAE